MYTIKQVCQEFWVCYPHQTTSPNAIFDMYKQAKAFADRQNNRY